MRWGDVDYKQLQKLRDNLQKLQDMDLDTGWFIPSRAGSTR